MDVARSERAGVVPAPTAVWRARRVIVFGLDAVSWDVVDRVALAMPTLDRLRREGSVGVLESTLPPITPVAWTSMVTGVSPGRHGIYEFVRRSDAGWRPVTRLDVRAPALDEWLERHGRRSILVNLPVSHPGRSGAIRLQDFLSPNPEPVDPPSLKERSAALAAYQPFYAPGAIADRSVDEMVAEVRDLEARRLAAARYLLTTQPWQFLFYGVTGTDHLQHRALDQILGPDPVPETILAAYREVDRALGTIVDAMREGDLLIVASDHGSAVLRREFLVNEWLVAQGLARWRVAMPARAPALAAVRRAAFALGLDRMGRGLRRRLGLRLGAAGGGPLAQVDEARSAAYMPAAFAWPALYVPGADVAGLAARLRALCDPRTGEAVFSEVLTAAEAYPGERVEGAPDLVLLPAPGFAVHPGRGGAQFRDVLKNHHKRDGIVLLYAGHRLDLPRDLGRRRVEDVAPTVLSAFGLPVPASMEGVSILPSRPADDVRRAVRDVLRGLGRADGPWPTASTRGG
jgi:predicted AlkP superfamily phosphohydrolase/phosphomutase